MDEKEIVDMDTDDGVLTESDSEMESHRSCSSKEGWGQEEET